jgi:succinate dehydrogenase cytochrome b556 subunit
MVRCCTIQEGSDMAEMAIKKKRPKHLDLVAIRLPLPGFVSILHRVSGAGLFLMLPLLLWLFAGSLASPEGFAATKQVLAYPLVKLIMLGLTCSSTSIWASICRRRAAAPGRCWR